MKILAAKKNESRFAADFSVYRMTKFFFILLILLSAAAHAQEKKDTLKIKSDSLKVKADSLSKKADSLTKKADILKAKADSLIAWKKGGLGAINFSQVSLTNWSAGGENSMSAVALVNLFAHYKRKRTSWDNTLDLAYGFVQSGSAAMRKSDDRMELTTEYGYKTTRNWHIAAVINFKSQFSPGYNYPNDSVITSNFLAPGYILTAIGLDYMPDDHFSFFISPLSGKITVINNQALADLGTFGNDKAQYDVNGSKIADGKRVRTEFGALASIKYKKEIMKNVTLKTKVDLFSNYLKNPQNIDVNWDLLLNLRVNKYVAASITTQMIYYNDVKVPVYQDVGGVNTKVGEGPRLQFKEVLGIGFSYKF